MWLALVMPAVLVKVTRNPIISTKVLLPSMQHCELVPLTYLELMEFSLNYPKQSTSKNLSAVCCRVFVFSQYHINGNYCKLLGEAAVAHTLVSSFYGNTDFIWNFPFLLIVS